MNEVSTLKPISPLCNGNVGLSFE